MATTGAAIKRTLEGHLLAPIGAERTRQPPSNVHGRTGTGEAGCLEGSVPPFSHSHHLCDIAGTLVLEGLSPAASRSRRRQAARAVSWTRDSGLTGEPTPGGPTQTRGRGTVEDGSPHRGLPRLEEGNGGSTAAGHDQLAGHPSRDTCTCGWRCPVFDSPDEDDPPLKGSRDKGPQPVPIPYQARDPFPRANCAGDPGDLKNARQPMNPVVLPWNARCPGNTGKLGPVGDPAARTGIHSGRWTTSRPGRPSGEPLPRLPQ